MKRLTTLLIVMFIITTNCAFAQINRKDDKEAADKKVFYLNLEWWDSFNNPELHGYLERVFINNHDLRVANLKIKEGEQIVKQSIANELPQIGLSGNVERTLRASDQYFGPNMLIPNFSQTNLLFPLSANYELDIWGKNHTKTKSVKKQLEIIKEKERAQYIAVTGNFTSLYYNLVKCDKLIKLQEELVSLQTDMVDLVNLKFEYGKCPVTELIAQKKILKSYQEELNILQKERAILEEDLKVVMADPEIESIPDTSCTDIPVVNFPSRIPSDVIETRPDYLASEYYLESMGLDVKAARKNLLPRFIIFGQFGFNAYQLSNLFNGNALLSSIGVAPVLDIFTGGRKMAYLRYKKYEYEEALENYKKTVLVSYKEVNDALISAKTNRANFLSAQDRLILEEHNYELIKSAYLEGKDTKPNMLRAQENKLAVEKDKINYQTNTLISVIGLYKAAGGKNLNDIKEDI